MKKFIKYMVCLTLVLTAGNAWAWNKMGHEAMAILASERLTPQAQDMVSKILPEGDLHTNAYWLNTLKKDNKYAATRHWHHTTLDAQGRSTTQNANDGIVQLERNIEILRNRQEHSDSLVVAALNTVVHLVGDLHCVAHIRFEDIPHSKGFGFYRSNGKSMNPKDKKSCPRTSWYKIWSHWYFALHGGFSSEMYANDIKLCQGDKFNEYASGTPREWVEDMGREARPLLAKIQPNGVLDSTTALNWELIHERCVAKASVRLAVILNDIFK
ncbi:MAG: hypothetical protein IJW42_01005 [Alistipes sp.]|nr:hypothetical protein [Alistipes sp.]